MPEDQRPKIVHQSGVKETEAVRERYARLGIEAEVVPFIDDMGAAYSRCDLVISRAGAISVSELLAGRRARNHGAACSQDNISSTR